MLRCFNYLKYIKENYELVMKDPTKDFPSRVVIIAGDVKDD